jgi:heterodisulfide reductase subunit C
MSARSRLAKKWRRAKSPSRFEADLDPGFAGEVMAQVEDGERLLGCLQCGTCAGACPLSAFMDRTPRRLMEMIRAGARDEVLASSTIWVCASCYACTVECPKQIPITEIMHGLRRMAFAQDAIPKGFSNPYLVRELARMAETKGRSTESWVAMRAYLQSDPMQLPKNAIRGMELMKRGRMGLIPDTMREPEQLTKMLEAVER